MSDIKEVIERIKDILVNQLQPEKIILFGSAVDSFGSKNTEDSDIDLLIVKEMQNVSTNPVKRASIVRAMIKPYLWPLDIIVYTPAEFEKYKNIPFSFLNSILDESIVLYERNR